MDYSKLSEKDKCIVEKRLNWKCLTTFETYTSFDEMCAKYLKDEHKDQYILRTRGHQTASKVKCFMKSPEEYHIRYNLELPEPVEKDSRHFVVGQAFDCLMSYGMEKFNQKFFIDKGLVKDALIKDIKQNLSKYMEKLQGMKEKAFSNIDLKISELKSQSAIQKYEDIKKNLMVEDVVDWISLDDLRNVYYDEGSKIQLTPAEGRDVIGMYYEAMRQPQFDVNNKNYEPQKYLECKYRDKLIISGTLDRYNKDDKMIRDRKTSGNIDNFERDIENTFDYVTQMSFYYVLCFIAEGVECDVYLDIMSKKAPYTSIAYRLSIDKLKRKMQNDLKPALDQMIRCFEKNERPASDRYYAMKSPYYPIMEASIMVDVVDSN